MRPQVTVIRMHNEWSNADKIMLNPHLVTELVERFQALCHVQLVDAIKVSKYILLSY